MLVDDVRKDVSPKKGLPANWLRVMEEAQSLHLTTSATNVIGFGESNRQRVEHMRRVRDLQDASLSQHGMAFRDGVARANMTRGVEGIPPGEPIGATARRRRRQRRGLPATSRPL